MTDGIVWTKGEVVRVDNGRPIYSFTASRGSWSIGVYAHDLEEAERKLAQRRSNIG